MNRIELKTDAKESLKDKWAETIKMLLIFIIINLGVYILFKYILQFGIYEETIMIEDQEFKYTKDYITPIINIFLSFGFFSYFLKISRNKEVTCNELFSKINMAFKYIVMAILTSLVVVIGFFCLIIPGVMLLFGLSQTTFILLDNPDMSVIEAMKLSWNMMKGYKMDYFILILSFLGWAFILIFTLGMGYFWLFPYIQVTLCNFYNNIKEEYKEKTE